MMEMMEISKAFDTAWHATLFNLLALHHLSDFVYNWLVNYLIGHYPWTRFKNTQSRHTNIDASVIQGSALGPAAYIVAAFDLRSIAPGKKFNKYPDDCYLLV